MKKSLLSFALLGALTLSACSTMQLGGNGAVSDTDGKIKAAAAAKRDASYVLSVPASQNFISNKIAVASLKAGSGSNAVDALVSVLKAEKMSSVTVIGDNDDVTVATIQSAIKRLDGAATSTHVYFVGAKEAGAELVRSVEGLGVIVEVVEY